jgi:hypothetical protein
VWQHAHGSNAVIKTLTCGGLNKDDGDRLRSSRFTIREAVDRHRQAPPRSQPGVGMQLELGAAR